MVVFRHAGGVPHRNGYFQRERASVDILQAEEVATTQVLGAGGVIVSVLRRHLDERADLRAVRVGWSALALATLAGALAGNVLGGNRAKSGVRQRPLRQL